MRHRRTPTPPAPWGIAFVLASCALAGCAELHRGAEAVGRVGTSAPSIAAVDEAPARPAIRTVRPRGAPRTAAADAGPAEAASPAVVAAVPSPRQIFDFHPPGSSPDSWRQPFLIDTDDGPLAADVRRSAAELRSFLAARRAGAAATAAAAPRRCGETDVATARPGCGPLRPPDGAAPR